MPSPNEIGHWPDDEAVNRAIEASVPIATAIADIRDDSRRRRMIRRVVQGLEKLR